MVRAIDGEILTALAQLLGDGVLTDDEAASGLITGREGWR